MKASILVALVAVLLVAPTRSFWSLQDFLAGKSNIQSNGGGTNCAACSIALTLLEQLAELHSNTIEEELDQVCDLFPVQFEEICVYFVNTYGAEIIQLFDEYEDSDKVCHGLEFCTDPTCNLGTTPPQRNSDIYRTTGSFQFKDPLSSTVKNPGETPWDWILYLVQRLEDHEPMLDLDDDSFSDVSTLRGANWRGRDCDDGDATVYPGRRFLGSNPEIDHNCNGIFGTAPNGSSWEELLCGNSQPMGVFVMGDSAGAHFEIPPAYFTASLINSSTFDDLFTVVSDEIDLPHYGGYTGFMPNTTTTLVDSIYLRMRARNRCNHRDYQNMGVNGARSGSMAPPGIANSIARNATTDYPAIVFLELIGNDVCHGQNTTSVFTPPAEFYNNTLTTLKFLDQTLPKGSKVMTVGLAPGTLLWDSLWNRTHPLGVTYQSVYNFLNCLSVSPCWGWMNSNETVRNETQEAANVLSGVYSQVISENTFQNIEVAYTDFPFQTAAKIWEAQGGQIWQLIEACDGFHPNQITNYLLAQVYWNILETQYPDWLGPVNPYNDLIDQLFGDQGGY